MISRAIDSILKQTFIDFEIIVVDDGSVDETGQVVGAILDVRIKYFKKINEERSIARNYGVAKAKGRYINFLDSDDEFYTQHLQTAYELLLANNFPPIVHNGFEIVNSEGTVLLRRDNLNASSVNTMIYDNVFHCNAIFVNSELALKYTFPNHRDAIISEDWCFFLKLISRFKVLHSNTITSRVFDHDQRSLKHINPDKLIASTKIIVNELKNDSAFLQTYGGRAGYFFANQYTFVSLILALSKQRRKETIFYLSVSIKYSYGVLLTRRFWASIRHLF